MNFPCERKSDCSPVAADAIVVRNFSAENPDALLEFSIFYSPPGFPFTPTFGFCGAPTIFAAQVCSATPSPNSPLGPTFPPVFTNTEQSCVVNGEVFTVPAGMFVAPTQADADALALSFACSGNDDNMLIGNEPQSCSQICDGQSVSYSVPANVFHALDQATANAFAFVFACLVLSLYCQQGIPEAPPTPTAPNLKQSCSVPCGTGTFTFVIPYNTYRADNQAAANAVASTNACNLASENRTCITCPTATACEGEEYLDIIETDGPLSGQVSTISVASGALPTGITLSGNILNGTPTTPGNYDFTLRANFVDGHTVTQQCRISVVGISGTLDNGTVSDPYSEFVSATGFTSPVFSVASGALPDGLSLNSATGEISGTPTVVGDFDFVIQVDG